MPCKQQSGKGLRIAEVWPSRVEGEVEAPPSKSYTHRAIALASLSTEQTTIRKPLLSRDTLATINASRALGVDVTTLENTVAVRGIGGFRCPDDVINVENSGTTLRIYTGLAALVGKGYTVLTGDESIRKRPLGPLLKALNQLGVECWSTRENGRAPVVVKGGCYIGGHCKIVGGESSQYITSLLITGLAANEKVVVEVEGELVSKPYVDATVRMVEIFGGSIAKKEYGLFEVQPQTLHGIEFTVPGDFSSAAFIVAAAHLTKGHAKITNLTTSLPQADAFILKIAEMLGSEVVEGDGYVEVYGGESDVDVDIKLTDSPDLLPITACMAAMNNGEVKIHGVAHARLKESDRIAAVASELRKLGVEVEETQEGLVVKGSRKLEGGILLDSHGDHRLFMAFAVLGLALPAGLKVAGAESADVSYPAFLDDITRIGGKITVH